MILTFCHAPSAEARPQPATSETGGKLGVEDVVPLALRSITALQTSLSLKIAPSPHGTAAPPSLRRMGTMGDRSENLAFGQRIRAAMAVARVSRQDVARACGISPQAVQRWCDGTSYPSSSKLITFCNMTGCSAEWLLWPHPVDIRSTDWAINGTHIKNIVRQAMDDLAAEQPTPPISPEEAQFNAVRYHERFGPLDEKGNPVDPRRRG